MIERIERSPLGRESLRGGLLMIMLSLVLFGAGSFQTLHAQTVDEASYALEQKNYLEAIDMYRAVLQQKPKEVAALVGIGDAYMALEYYDTAATYYQRAYDQKSKDAQINMKYGTALSLTGQHSDAIRTLMQAYKYDDKSLVSRMALAEAYIQMGTDSLDKAELLILGANKDFPNNAVVKAALGDLYFQKGVYPLAESNYKQAVDLDPTLIQARIKLGLSYRAQGIREKDPEFYPEALKQFNYVTENAPTEPIPWRQQGEIYYLYKQYAKAIESYRQYQYLRPDDSLQSDRLLMIAASDGGYYQDALEYALRVLARNDERSSDFHGEARMVIARGYYSKGQDFAKADNQDSATYYYSQAAQAFNNTPDSTLAPNDFIYQGTARMWAGDTARGLQSWMTLINYYPDSCQLAYNLTRAMYKLQRYDELLASLRNLEASCGENFDETVPLLRGLTYLQIDSVDAGIMALNKAIEIDSTNLDAYYWILNSLIQKERYSEVTPLATIVTARVGTVFPVEGNEAQLAYVNYFNGVAAFKAEKYKDAIEAFKKAVDYKKDFSTAYLYIAVSYHSLKDKENACTYYKKTLQYEPGNTTAQSNLKKLGC